MDLTRRALLLSGMGAAVLSTVGDINQLSVRTRLSDPVRNIAYPAIAAHRGGRDLYPEGSMIAFRACVANYPGTILEMDVRPLKDGTLVVCHDATVDRIATGGVTGKVADMTVSQWQALKVKNTSGTATGQAAFLSDVITEYGGTDVVLMIELKDYSEAARNRYVEQLWPYREQLVSACFDTNVARMLAGSGFSGQYLATKPPAEYPPWADHVALLHENITPTVVQQAHAAGAKLWAWTVNDAATKHRLLAMGVDGIITDNPTI